MRVIRTHYEGTMKLKGCITKNNFQTLITQNGHRQIFVITQLRTTLTLNVIVSFCRKCLIQNSNYDLIENSNFQLALLCSERIVYCQQDFIAHCLGQRISIDNF